MAKIGTSFSDDLTVEKYYGQRHRLWSRFDEGVWMTKRGWFEVTPENIARSSSKIHQTLKKRGSVLELFCGCGGDTVQLARVYDKVIAVDIDIDAIEAAKHNVAVYGVSDRVSFICSDIRSLKVEDFSVDAVHCSPPWGGEMYCAGPFFDIDKSLEETIGMKFSKLFEFILGFSKNITMFLPRNILLYSLIPCGFKGNFEVVRHYVNERCKALTVVWGDLVDCSSLKDPLVPQYILKDKVLPRLEKRARGS
ncbi:putative PIMT protein [Trypanosoma theileri]|uniref:Trimethylguanosine synthase n=1 Tax=Trypanosoma theileri TaxID=67003 RepID=A0A1X0NVB0_9TRYP|nr:putative PIMT protein [Trypanosoma theileri]ORC88625.1 putative PIMT protein [Trypanosoma theileri]